MYVCEHNWNGFFNTYFQCQRSLGAAKFQVNVKEGGGGWAVT